MTTLADLGYIYNPNKFRYEVVVNEKVVAWVAEELVLADGEQVIAREIYRVLLNRWLQEKEDTE